MGNHQSFRNSKMGMDTRGRQVVRCLALDTVKPVPLRRVVGVVQPSVQCVPEPRDLEAIDTPVIRVE